MLILRNFRRLAAAGELDDQDLLTGEDNPEFPTGEDNPAFSD